MSIQSEINRINTNVQNAIGMVGSMGGDVDPEQTYTSDDLTSLISSIPGGIPVPEPYPQPPYNMVELSFEEYQGYTLSRYGANNYSRVVNTGDNANYVYVAKVKDGSAPTATHNGWIMFYNSSTSQLLNISFFYGNPITYSSNYGYVNVVETADMKGDSYCQGWRFYNMPSTSITYVVISAQDYTRLSIREAYLAANVNINVPDPNDPEETISVWVPSLKPAYEAATKTISSNGTTTITPSYGYSAMSSVVVTTQVQPTINTKFVSISGASVSANSSKVYDLGTDISNTHPFVLTLLGGSYGSTSYATYETCIKYNGSGTFTVTQSDTGTYATTVNTSRCSIDSSGQLTVYFTKAYYPWGTSSSSTTRKAVLTYV